MKDPDAFLTNAVTATTNRPGGAAKDNPGDNSGSGMVAEVYNDPAYAILAAIYALKEGGISGLDEGVTNSDFLDAIREAIGQAVDGIDDWVSGTTYSTLGTLVFHKGIQYVNYYVTGNTGQEPVPGSAYWYAIPSRDTLIEEYQNGVPKFGMHPTLDRAHAKYAQLIEFGKYRLGDNGDDFYDFYRITLDGTVVTGDADLVEALDVGGANEYPFLDIFFPDLLGTRSAIDMGERAIVGQSSGGESDTIGEEQDHQMQGHKHKMEYLASASSRDNYNLVQATIGTGGILAIQDADSETGIGVDVPKTDGAHGTPNIGNTTHGKQLVNGAAYIISMIPA